MWGKYCVTAAECKKSDPERYAYKSLKRCILASQYDYYPESQFVQYDDGSYGCNSDYYLSFHYENSKPVVTCLKIDNVSSSMYLIEEASVYADEQACGQVLNMYTLKDEETMLCVTM